MNNLVVVEKPDDWRHLKKLVLDTVASPITRRVYDMALDEFFEWYRAEPRPGLSKAVVNDWRASLQARQLGSSSINNRLSAIRKLAVEAADNGLLGPEIATAIGRVKGAKSQGVRLENWLSPRQAHALLNAPDTSILKGVRDRGILAVLFGCGLRRSEVAALTMAHIQQRDGRWCIVDLLGKHGRIRTVPMPTWVKVAIDAWATFAVIAEHFAFRPVDRRDQCRGDRLSDKVIWQLLRGYAREAGVFGIAPYTFSMGPLFVPLLLIASDARAVPDGVAIAEAGVRSGYRPNSR